MPDIRYVVVSDLHFGAENSVLTDLVVGRPEVDPTSAGEVMTLLVECLQDLVAANEDWTKPTLVLGGDVLELALADDHVAAMVFERFMSLVFSHSERLFADTVYFVPGNHDHHLWEAARERHYAELVRRVPRGEQLPAPTHATRMLADTDEVPVTAQLLTALVQRNPDLADVTVRTVYPNLGFIDEHGHRALVYHHGHYLEPLYSLISTMNGIMFGHPAPADVAQLEAENFAWVDFFWSTLGRSGDAGRGVGLAYDSLQSREATEQLVHNLVRGGVSRLHMPHVVRHGFEDFVRFTVDRIAHHVMNRERRHPDAVLSANAESGLREYAEGPLLRQLADECNGDVPESVTFLFGHTHKPFVGRRVFEGYRNPVEIANTGGWVVDAIAPIPVHGAAAVLIDENLDAVLLEMYTQQSTPGDYQVTVKPLPGSGDGAFARRVDELISTDPRSWAAFSTAVAHAVAVRNRDLRMIIDRQPSAEPASDSPAPP